MAPFSPMKSMIPPQPVQFHPLSVENIANGPEIITFTSPSSKWVNDRYDIQPTDTLFGLLLKLGCKVEKYLNNVIL